MPLFHIKGIHVYIQYQVHVPFPKPWQVALHIKHIETIMHYSYKYISIMHNNNYDFLSMWVKARSRKRCKKKM